MAENNYITHAFVSPKADSPDSTLIRPSNWNDGHTLSGGINGQVLIYDTTQPNNMRWTDGRFAVHSPFIISSSTAVPIIGAAAITRTFNSMNLITVHVQIREFTTVGGASGTIQTTIDGTVINEAVVISGTSYVTFLAITTITAGSHTVALNLTTTGNVNILTASLSLLIEFSGI